MEEGSEVIEDIVFRGVEFSVKIEVIKGVLIVEISELLTADQWRGEFDPAYVEDLTRKTGNFKQFPIFCSMLESAVRKTSDSVTLDLLTYADLELLRNRKAGVVSRPRGLHQASALTAKRYLILIYTVEFDRIHYPLPLPYLGKPDPAVLQKEVRALKAELNGVASHGVNKSADAEIQRLRTELALVREEKEAMAKVLERLQLSAGNSTSDREDWRVRDVMRTLEEQLIKERAKSQRSAAKRCQEQRLLMEQLEELRASELALRVRVKSLTSELAFLRRGEEDGIWDSPGSFRIPGAQGRQSSKVRGKGEKSRLIWPTPQHSQTVAFSYRQRKLRRDMLASPVVPERGRSRSREAYPQLVRSNSRGRSLSVERRGSRNSSDSSVVDMEEMTKTLFRGKMQMCNGPSGLSEMSRSRLTRKPLSSTPTYRMKDKGLESSVDAGAELSEIDARLQALQEYMRDLDTGH
ncbi:Coiled-coil domain-containing protein 61 [Takifugu flavidus]|uniref:Centrosomal protein CCDC61 n=1 Tax=Takifugu flavidus TaxID=433684 RepID=A0A5C6P675_9TELE|nr:Coiled-coil domain-containing protein 61 [Takifugu flavidus]